MILPRYESYCMIYRPKWYQKQNTIKYPYPTDIKKCAFLIIDSKIVLKKMILVQHWYTTLVKASILHDDFPTNQTYDVLIATKSYQHGAFILMFNLNTIHLINNHIRHLTYQHNHPNKLLILDIVHQIVWSTHNITIHKVISHIGRIIYWLGNQGTTCTKPTPHPTYT